MKTLTIIFFSLIALGMLHSLISKLFSKLQVFVGSAQDYGTLDQHAVASAQSVSLGSTGSPQAQPLSLAPTHHGGCGGGGCGTGNGGCSGQGCGTGHGGSYFPNTHFPTWPNWPPRGWVPRGNGWWCDPSPCRFKLTQTWCWGWSQRRIIRPCEGIGRCSGNCANCTPWNRCTDRVRRH